MKRIDKTLAATSPSRLVMAALLLATPVAFAEDAADAPASPAASAEAKAPEIMIVKVPGSTVDVELVPVPGPDGKPLFHLGRTEITWDLYDVFVFGHDQEAGLSTPEADAVTRPSKPYVATDRGLGHNGYPAISISYRGATYFCEWLSAKTGKKFRLPTVEEWKLVCAAAQIPADQLDEYAWTDENSGGTSHPPASKKPDALGISDLFGNAGEWVVTEDRKGAVVGGNYVAPAAEASCEGVLPYTKDWNKSDPQFPKSVWWLCDGGFIGFRVLCENP